MTPNDQMSHFPATVSEFNKSSGAIYRGEPKHVIFNV